MPTFCGILEFIWLTSIIENDFERKFSNFITFILLLMSFISYYKCVTIKNNTLLRNVPYIESTVVDPIARDVKSCPNCNDKWKPPRSHHCSSCGTC